MPSRCWKLWVPCPYNGKKILYSLQTIFVEAKRVAALCVQDTDLDIDLAAADPLADGLAKLWLQGPDAVGQLEVAVEVTVIHAAQFHYDALRLARGFPRKGRHAVKTHKRFLLRRPNLSSLTP